MSKQVNPQDLGSLPKRTRAVYCAIEKAIAEQGFPPSVREIALAVGLSSPSSVKHQLDILEVAGLLRRHPGQPRAMELISRTSKSSEDATKASTQQLSVRAREDISLPVSSGTSIPLVGRIAAGAPITATQQVDEIYDIPSDFTGTGSLFMLRVAGDSMVDAAICDGDYVIVRAQPDATDGDIVAAMLDGEATVKVLSRSNDHVWLLPRNENYDPIPGDECTIMGKVVTVMRRL